MWLKRALNPDALAPNSLPVPLHHGGFIYCNNIYFVLHIFSGKLNSK